MSAFCPSPGRHKTDPLCPCSCTGPGPAVSSVRVCPTRVATERARALWARSLLAVGNAVSKPRQNPNHRERGDETPPGPSRPISERTNHPETFFPKRAGSYMRRCRPEARPARPPSQFTQPRHSHGQLQGTALPPCDCFLGQKGRFSVPDGKNSHWTVQVTSALHCSFAQL